jgi:peptidoglycan/xylan/chitin deacetylase (PgdA/CDA1 family)
MNVNFPWPEGKKAVVALSVNFDADAYDLLNTTPDRLFGRFSYGRYGVQTGLPRLLGLFDDLGIRATFFVCGLDAQRHPGAVREIVQAGHELGSRGENLGPVQAEEAELGSLCRGVETLRQITGTDVSGYRAPNGELGAKTLQHLAQLGLEYDASFQDDDVPYRIATAHGDIVEIPMCYALNDAHPYSARHTNARVTKIWREEAQALREVGGLIPLTLQLRGDFGSTRGSRIVLLRDFLVSLKNDGTLKFMRHDEIAALTRSAGVTAEPDPISAHVDTLLKTEYRGDLAVRPH